MPTRARLTIRRPVANRSLARVDVFRDSAPIVKWAGGKTKLLPELLARAPESYRRYYEPFIGGGALFFKMAPRVAVLNDKNPDLCNTYRCLSWNVDAIIRRLARLRTQHSEEHFYATRERWNEQRAGMTEVEKAAVFIYLNKTCYNGLWRVNSQGKFNVPVARYDNPQIYDPMHLRAASVQLRRAEIATGHFADAVQNAGSNDFVYFDPPYHPLTETANFTSYTADNFGKEDQRELASVFKQLDKRGAHVLLSNSDTPFIRDLYKGYRIDQVECARAINSRAANRGPVSEVIISNR
jgi:DNA adenine methylase